MATELVDGVWWFDLRGVNAYLADDGGTLTLVDAGTPLSAPGLTDELATVGYSPREIDRVLVTHYDVDHVGTLGKLSGLDAPVHIGREDAALLTDRRTPKLTSPKGFLHRVTRPFVREPTGPIEPVEDGEELGSFTAHHTPGHTDGHTVYASEELSVAFLGDMVVEKDGDLVVPPRPLNEDTTGVRISIRAFARRMPAFDVAAMGHGVPFTENGSERLAALADSLNEQ